MTSTTADSAEQTARAVHDSLTVEVLARLGLFSRGLLWGALGFLALSLVRGMEAQADQTGALRTLASAPLGELLLIVLAVGFAGYATWLLLEAAVGYRREQGRERLLHRGKSAFKGVVYLALSISTAQFLSRGEGGGTASSRTAEVMARPGGRTAVGLVGLVLLGIGLYLVVKGITRKHAECLEQYRVPRLMRRPGILVGAVGYVGRGFTLGLVGAFLLRAAVQFEPRQAQGLDAALQTVVQQPYGRILLGLMVIGVLAYALWSFFEAAFREI